MISLPKIILSDTDVSAAGQTAKLPGDAQDFLSLLAGALSAKTGGDGKTALTLTDLQNAAAGLAKGDARAGAQKLNQLLGQAQEHPEAALSKSDAETLSDAQALLASLTAPLANTDAAKTLAQADVKTGLKSDARGLREDDLAGLSALMAMLPQAQTLNVPATTPSAQANVTLSGLASTAAQSGTSLAATELPGKGEGKNAPLAAKAGENPALAQNSPLAATAAVKAEAESAPTPTASTTPVAPMMSPATAQPAAVASVPTPTISAPLGSPDWQQNVSQHITLFTRQGQQSAELRLHPEDLGQIHISLKLDDNQAQLQMVSPHSHVRAALEAALPTLRTHLAESGIQLGQSNISSESFSGQQQQSFSQQQNASRSSAQGSAAAEEDDTLLAPASLQSLTRGTGAVDTFA